MPKVHFLDQQNFECTACGKCCTGGWNINVNAEAADTIRNSNIAAEREQRGYIPLKLLEGDQVSLSHTDVGDCIFLNESNLCDLHSEVGLERKPLSCRTYPRIITNTPDGYFVTLSFACPATLSHEGESVAAWREPLQRMVQEFGDDVPQNRPLTERVLMTEGHDVAWADYLKLESHLLDAFDPKKPSISILLAAEQLASAVARSELEKLLEGGFHSNSTPGDNTQQLLFLFVMNSLAIMEEEANPAERPRFMDQIAGGESVISPRHGLTLLPLYLPSQVRETDQHLIERYVQNVVFGKRLTGRSFLDGLLTLAVGLELLVYYLDAFQQQLPVQQAREKAFDLVETDIVTHSRGLHVLLNEFPKALLGSLT